MSVVACIRDVYLTLMLCRIWGQLLAESSGLTTTTTSSYPPVSLLNWIDVLRKPDTVEISRTASRLMLLNPITVFLNFIVIYVFQFAFTSFDLLSSSRHSHNSILSCHPLIPLTFADSRSRQCHKFSTSANFF